MKQLMTFAIAATLAGMAVAVPSNDSYGTAKELSNTVSRGSEAGDNTSATTPADDPLAAYGYGRTLWYRWTAPANGILHLDTINSVWDSRTQDPFDTVLCICRCDSENVPYVLDINDDISSDVVTSALDYDVYAGTTYYIGIGTKRLFASGQDVYYYSSRFIRLNWLFTRELALVRFNPQGGTATITSISLLEGTTIGQCGTVPTPVRGGYDFLGWYTDPEGGVKVTADDNFNKIKDYVTEGGTVNLYAHWKLTGLETPQLQSFDRAQLFTGMLLTSTWGIVGSIEIKVAKKSAKNTAKLSIRITRYDTGKKISAKGTLTFKDDGSAESDDIAINFKAEDRKNDVMRMTVKPDGTFTMEGSYYFVKAGQVGGALTFDAFTFEVPQLEDDYFAYSPPAAPAGFHVIEEALPTNLTFSVVSQGRKFSFPKGKTLAYKRVVLDMSSVIAPTRRPFYVLQGLESSNANKALLKLTYQYKTGLFKGSFVVYMSNGPTTSTKKPTLQKYTVSVVGLVLNGKGFGRATLKNTNQDWVVFLNQ